MGGSFDINTILNLSQETVDSVYKSQVLKYTVSNLLTNLGSEGFAIVVPGVSCEKPNASTTNPEKKVNVISSKEIFLSSCKYRHSFTIRTANKKLFRSTAPTFHQTFHFYRKQNKTFKKRVG